MKQKEKTPQGVIVAAILGIVVLVGLGLMNGINGLLLTGAIAVIAGLAGWSAPQLRVK